MGLREFTDADGVAWRVWSIQPTNPAIVSPELRTGWLTFDCGSSRRRLSPIPDDWEAAEIDRLRLLCRVAKATRNSDPFLTAVREAEASGPESLER